MKDKIRLLMCLFISICGQSAFSQKNKEKPLDSTLEANSEKWKVIQHSKLFEIAKPEFGPYTTLVAEKLDSPVVRKKSTDGSGGSVSISSEGWDWDISKFKTVEKKKFYRMAIGTGQDTIELEFYIRSVSTEKKQTFLGKMVSKNDEGKDATLGYQKNVEGVVFTAPDSTFCRFFIEDYLSTRQITRDNPGKGEPITRGYILIKDDSLFTEPVMKTIGNPHAKFFFMQWQTGIFINNTKEKHIAVLMFAEPFFVRIRMDMDPKYKHAIAALFAVIAGAKDL